MKLVSKPFKGNWYYEVQVLMLVFQWQHDTRHRGCSGGLRIGRLHIWRDSAWLHGPTAPRWLRKLIRNFR